MINKQKLRQAYIRGMIDMSIAIITIGSYTYFGVYFVEKYLM